MKYIEVSGNTEAEIQASFDEATKDGIVLINLWSPWCGPCRMLAPVMEELAETNKIVKINTDDCNMLVHKLNIRSIPTILIYKDGIEVERETGAKSKQHFQNLIDKIDETAK